MVDKDSLTNLYKGGRTRAPARSDFERVKVPHVAQPEALAELKQICVSGALDFLILEPQQFLAPKVDGGRELLAILLLQHQLH